MADKGGKQAMPKTGSQGHYGGNKGGTNRDQIYGASGGKNDTKNRYPAMSKTKGHGGKKGGY